MTDSTPAPDSLDAAVASALGQMPPAAPAASVPPPHLNVRGQLIAALGLVVDARGALTNSHVVAAELHAAERCLNAAISRLI